MGAPTPTSARSRSTSSTPGSTATTPRGTPRASNVEGADARTEAAGQARFRSRDELRYSLRSLHLFAPWVRTIYLVTAGQRPSWLADRPAGHASSTTATSCPADALPTFNSQAIETALHRMPGLAEHFVYVNDDVFLGRPTPAGAVLLPRRRRPRRSSATRRSACPAPPPSPSCRRRSTTGALLAGRLRRRRSPRLMAHSPHPQRVSVLREIEERFADAVGPHGAGPVPQPDRRVAAVDFAQHYGLITGTAFAARPTTRSSTSATPGSSASSAAPSPRPRLLLRGRPPRLRRRRRRGRRDAGRLPGGVLPGRRAVGEARPNRRTAP